MGAVYVGTQLSVEREVAVKLLLPELGDDPVALARFEREAVLIAGMSHPNIVQMIDHGHDEGTGGLYLVMDYVQGLTLREVLEGSRLSDDLIVELGLQICAALAESHAQGVIHRDLKPENMMIQVSADGALVLKVLDFGIAQLQEADQRLTKTGAIFGTPLYMSPEQCRGEGIEARSDLYSLGAMFYEMMTGHPPFRGRTFVAMIAAHMNKHAPSLEGVLGAQANPAVNVEVTAVGAARIGQGVGQVEVVGAELFPRDLAGRDDAGLLREVRGGLRCGEQRCDGEKLDHREASVVSKKRSSSRRTAPGRSSCG